MSKGKSAGGGKAAGPAAKGPGGKPSTKHGMPSGKGRDNAPPHPGSTPPGGAKSGNN
jgi:hypothetical protein